MVECNLAKVEVASSNLVSRSIFFRIDKLVFGRASSCPPRFVAGFRRWGKELAQEKGGIPPFSCDKEPMFLTIPLRKG